MYTSRQILWITAITLFSVLLFPLKCYAAVETVQKWGDGRFEIFYFTTRRPFPWIVDPIEPDKKIQDNYPSGASIVIVCIIGAVLLLFFVGFIFLILYCIAKGSRNSTTTGAVLHSPPAAGILEPPRSMTSTTNVPQSNNNFPFGYRPENFSLNISVPDNSSESALHRNTSGPNTTDKPPDYSTVILSDFAGEEAERFKFPAVKPNKKEDTPPPQYDQFDLSKPNKR